MFVELVIDAVGESEEIGDVGAECEYAVVVEWVAIDSITIVVSSNLIVEVDDCN